MAESQQRPFSIRVFVPDGDPDGLRLIEKSNWTGVGVVFSGPFEWKNKNGVTLKEIQDEAAAAASDVAD